MLPIAQALELIQQHAASLPSRQVSLEELLGLVLAEIVVSDVDSPPHDKSIVDGYAVRTGDVAQTGFPLNFLEEITAGAVPTLPVRAGCCSRIMTGAPLPSGADAVVMVERTSVAESGEIIINEFPVRSGQNIVRQGASLHSGQTVLQRGRRVGPLEIGLLAEVGCVSVAAIPRPSVAILATGNELVLPNETPGPGQIRNSNGPLLTALTRRAGGLPNDLGIARDRVDDLHEACSTGLASDVLILSGGVSAGVLDLVPQVLNQLGVEQVFHKVDIKPGKPLWFGVKSRGNDLPATLVFGLPGNPISSFVCFEMFVRPALDRLAGGTGQGLRKVQAALTTDYHHRGGRVALMPGEVSFTSRGCTAQPLPWRGSGDIFAMLDATALLLFSGEDRMWHAGDEVTAYLLASG